jgi:formylglycine-generating enzyme required for sulfatase activity
MPQSEQKPFVFISYRHGDAAGTASHIGDVLAKEYGDARVFHDVTNIGPGKLYREVIEEGLDKCNIFLAVIGERWASPTNLERLKKEEDLVRIEVATALRRDVVTIPVLVDGAPVPEAETLPSDLVGLTDRHAITLRNDKWKLDFGALVKSLSSLPLSAPRTALSVVNPRDGLSYVLIPSGSFMMGAVPADKDAERDEKPQHEVTISEQFYLGQMPVTVDAYRRFTDDQGLEMPQAPKFNGSWSRGDHPIVRVTWQEADDYCEWAGGRLPTEAEWEYAARGGRADSKFPTGKSLNRKQAKYHVRTRKTHLYTEPAGDYPVNGFGLLHMVGNVWEWVADWYDSDEYGKRKSKRSRMDPSGPTKGNGSVVARGGSWSEGRDDLRVTNRLGLAPDASRRTIGFRCAFDQLPD